MRVLLVADTHIGFDLPLRPRAKRRRRGHDFMANFELALRPALEGEVDLVVHGGDLLDRSEVPAGLVELAMAPLARVAATGVPVFVVPGNHERSRIPRTLLTAQPNIHLFDEPKTVLHRTGTISVALSGFPYSRDAGRDFGRLVDQTGFRGVEADIRLLCIHQIVEGARVGPADFTFRRGRDIISGRAIPASFAAVLAGHIHRSQVLTRDLGRRPLAAPVVYPGSVERTSYAERDEPKHYVILDLRPSHTTAGALADVTFVPLPARPMAIVELDAVGLDDLKLTSHLRDRLSELPADAVVRVRVSGPVSPAALPILRAAHVRSLAPDSMNVTVEYPQVRRERPAG